MAATTTTTKSLMACPYVLSCSRTHLFNQSRSFFRKTFVSPSAIMLNTSTEAAVSLLWSSNATTNIYSKPQVDSFHYKVSKTLFSHVGNRKFCSRATHVSDAGSIDLPLVQSMEKKIKEHLNAESVSVKDVSGDGRHVYINVVSSAFEGQSAVNRQRMVYKAIWEELQNAVHAVDQMTTRTPSEATAEK
ncbi:BolA domain-containing protein [Cephalotus follicularis]|uniref:BolA domain-containing protein n=1 Tax=Cephalotus follicularis TaxID=3775 RepID=A0A1Q3BRW5_CEPFO|nr:BolA domain-containing protein [Cephalotus follicularis]